jgi:spore coat polysaccharide biosynthesis protein SpsF
LNRKINPNLWIINGLLKEEMNTKTVAIIQARMGSSRLPGKVLMPILERPMLYYVVERLKQVESIDQIVVATSDLPRDDEIAHFCRSNNVNVSRGSETDVLDRYYQTANKINADVIIRVTADCPLIDPVLIEKLITEFTKSNTDYYSIAAGAPASNKHTRNRFPEGLVAEIFTIQALFDAWQNGDKPDHREHVTPYIWKNEEKFRIGIMTCRGADFSNYRWTVDNPEDFKLVQWIYENLYEDKPSFNMHDVLDLLDKTPSMMKINQHFIGKEGYEKICT